MMIYKVGKDDSRDLGFAHMCCLSGAINVDEFKTWVYWVIEHTEEELPTFFFDLDTLPDMSRSFYEAVGFVPSTGLSGSEEDAIDGIAYLRGVHERTDYDVHIGRDEALAALQNNPQVNARFREMFPFIEF